MLADVIDGQDVGVIERRNGSGLLLEAPKVFAIARKSGGEDLDGDIAFDGWSALHARDRKPDPQVYAVGTGRLLHQLRRLLFGESSCKSKRGHFHLYQFHRTSTRLASRRVAELVLEPGSLVRCKSRRPLQHPYFPNIFSDSPRPTGEGPPRI